jgi:hypothetical protein
VFVAETTDRTDIITPDEHAGKEPYPPISSVQVTVSLVNAGVTEYGSISKSI